MNPQIPQTQALQFRLQYYMASNAKRTAKKRSSRLLSKSFRNLDMLDAVDESPVGSPKVSDAEWGQIPNHRRVQSTKHTPFSPFHKMLTSPDEVPDETPSVRRKASDISFASMRSTNQTFSKFHSRAASIDRRLQYGIHFLNSSSPEPSHAASLGEFGHIEVSSPEHGSVKKRAHELMVELVSAIKAHENQIEQLLNDLGGQVFENNNNTLDSKVSELIESMIIDTAGLSTIEWENKLESMKKELSKVSARNDQMAQSLKTTQAQIHNEHKEHQEIERILFSKTTPDEKVKKLNSLLDEKKGIIQQIELKRAKSERETKDIRVVLKRKQEELDLWRNKAEKLARDNKAKDSQMKEATLELTKVRKNLDIKTRENRNLIRGYPKIKEEMMAKNELEAAVLETKISELITNSKDIDIVYGKLGKEERENMRLNIELQESLEEIKKLEELLEKEESAADAKIRILVESHEDNVAELKKEHAAKIQIKNKETKAAAAQLQELSKESLERQGLIGKLTSSNEMLKKKLHDQVTSNKSKEDFYSSEISQLKRRTNELSSILQTKHELKSKKY